MDETLIAMVRDRAQQKPNATPLTVLGGDGQESALTYAALDSGARLVGSHLEAALARGSRVLLAGPTGEGFITAFFGCLYAGMLPVPVPPPLPGPMADRFHAIMADCDPSLLLTSEAWLPLFRHVPVPLLAFENIEGSDQFVPARIDPDDLAYVQYTSGATGSPRGAVLTHRQACEGLRLTCLSMPAFPGQRKVGWLPLFHDLGLFTMMLLPIYREQNAFVMQPQDFVREPSRWLREMSIRRAAYGSVPGFAFDLMLRRTSPEQRAALDLTECICLVCGAEVLEPSSILAFADAFSSTGLKLAALCPSYGMAEAVGVVAASHPDVQPSVITLDRHSLERGWLRADSSGVCVVGSGRPGAGVTIRIVDQKHPETLLDDGAIGEVVISGPHITTEYWGLPNSALTIDSKRYLRTGDVGGFLDGELYLLGRTADRIVLRDRIFYPFDLERTVTEASSAVRPGACMAFTGHHGVVIAAELRSRSEEPPATIAKAIRCAVFDTHGVEPEDVVLVRKGALTVTTSGKPCRRASQRRYRAGELEDIS